MPTLRLRLQEPFDLTNPTVRSRPNSRDMCPRYIETFRNFRIRILRSWTHGVPVRALLGAKGQGIRARTDLQEGPSKGATSSDQE
ncbi:unnamed protein product [Prunus armeniaca]